MKSAFVFDMGGVIKKSFDYSKLLEYSKLNITLEEFRKLFLDSIYLVQTGKMDEDEFFLDFITKAKLNLSLDEFKEIYVKSFNTLFPDSIEVLNKLQMLNKDIYLYSYLKPIDYKCLSNLMDLSIFKKLYLSYEVGYDKTSVESFTYLINDLNLPKENIYFFDNEEPNINAALKAGISAYLTTGDNIKEIFELNNLYEK